MKKFILFAIIATMMVSCSDAVSKEPAPQNIVDTERYDRLIQVVYEMNGEIMNVKDTKFIFPKNGDTVIVCESDILLKDSSVISSNYIWGVPTNNIDIDDMDVNLDSTSFNYYKAVVRKTILLTK